MGAFYNDWLDTIDLDDRIEFPYEPQGNKFPKRKKKIVSEWSCPSWDGDGNFDPAVESTLSEGVDPNSGEWNLKAEGLSLAQRNKLEEFFEADPPNDRFVFYKDRFSTAYSVEVTEFEGEPDKFGTYTCNFTLKNKGEAV